MGRRVKFDVDADSRYAGAIKLIRGLAKLGVPITAIAKHMNTTPTTVRHVINHTGGYEATDGDNRRVYFKYGRFDQRGADAYDRIDYDVDNILKSIRGYRYVDLDS